VGFSPPLNTEDNGGASPTLPLMPFPARIAQLFDTAVIGKYHLAFVGSIKD